MEYTSNVLLDLHSLRSRGQFCRVHLVEDEREVHGNDDEDPTDLESIELFSKDNPVAQERVDEPNVANQCDEA